MPSRAPGARGPGRRGWRVSAFPGPLRIDARPGVCRLSACTRLNRFWHRVGWPPSTLRRIPRTRGSLGTLAAHFRTPQGLCAKCLGLALSCVGVTLCASCRTLLAALYAAPWEEGDNPFL